MCAYYYSIPLYFTLTTCTYIYRYYYIFKPIIYFIKVYEIVSVFIIPFSP